MSDAKNPTKVMDALLREFFGKPATKETKPC